jgi:hypothetical protein
LQWNPEWGTVFTEALRAANKLAKRVQSALVEKETEKQRVRAIQKAALKRTKFPST